MDPARAMAEQSVGALWREGDWCGLIDASPMRPGRGRRAGPSKDRRREDRRGLERFEETVRSIEDRLLTGSLSPAAARQQAYEAGLGEFIRIAETREEAIEAFAHFYGLGYYLWSAGDEQNATRAGLLRASFATRKELT